MRIMVELKVERRKDMLNATYTVDAPSGNIDTLADELAYGAAVVLVNLVDRIPSVDELYESYARVFCSRVLTFVDRVLEDKAAESNKGQTENAPVDA